MPQEMKMTPEIVAALVGAFREMRGWSQETLAELARVNVRTLQRVESKQPGSADTLRALARAFELSDIDYFLKSHSVDTAEDIAAEKQRLEKDYVGISVESPACGRSLAAAVHGADASALHVFGEGARQAPGAAGGAPIHRRGRASGGRSRHTQRVESIRALARRLFRVPPGWSTHDNYVRAETSKPLTERRSYHDE